MPSCLQHTSTLVAYHASRRLSTANFEEEFPHFFDRAVRTLAF